MRSILHNVKASTQDLNPVAKMAVYSLVGVIVTAAIALVAGVLISGAPNF